VHENFTYNLRETFNNENININNTCGIHFVNHHSLVKMYQDKISIFPDHLYYVDGTLLSLLLKFKRIRHDYLPGPIFFQDNMENLPSETMFIVANLKNKDALRNKGEQNISIAPKITEENVEVYVASLNLSAVTHIVLGIGSPAQDLLANKITAHNKKVTVWCVGAAVEFYLGTQKNPPSFIRMLRLEWAWRLMTNFNVTWRRIIISPIQLLCLLFKNKIF